MKWLIETLITLALVLLQSLCCYAESPRTFALDDFEDGNLASPSGPSWFALADDLIGGASEVRVEIRPAGPKGAGHALALTGRLGGGKPSFAGAWVSLDRAGRTVDLGAFDGVRLRVKSRVPLEVGLRSGSVNYVAPIEPGADWRVVEVPFSSLAPMRGGGEDARFTAQAEVFGVTTSQPPSGEDVAPAELDVLIDDVVLYGPSGEGRAEPVAAGRPAGLATVSFTPPGAIPHKGWVELGHDAEGDGRRPGLPDATRLEALASTSDDMVWFRVTLRDKPHERWIGVNLVLDVDGDPSNGTAWWGANAGFKFDRLVTVWCFRVADRCQGYVGAADAEEVAAGSFGDGSGQGVRFAIDRERRAFLVGVPRETLGMAEQGLKLVVAVGSALFFNDDVPGDGAASLR